MNFLEVESGTGSDNGIGFSVNLIACPRMKDLRIDSMDYGCTERVGLREYNRVRSHNHANALLS